MQCFNLCYHQCVYMCFEQQLENTKNLFCQRNTWQIKKTLDLLNPQLWSTELELLYYIEYAGTTTKHILVCVPTGSTQIFNWELWK